MKKYLLMLAIASSCLVATQANALTKDEYKAEKDKIQANYKVDKTKCDVLKDNAKDICEKEAKGKEKVAYAEAEYGYTGKPADQAKIMKVKAETGYAIAKEKCDDLAGNAKDVCIKEAKAVKVKALVDAKTSKQIAEVKMDGAQEKRDADYKVATEKCDAMAGDAKTNCISAAKAKFGKS